MRLLTVYNTSILVAALGISGRTEGVLDETGRLVPSIPVLIRTL